MIFGTLQHCFVVNTPVNSTLNNFITPVAPPCDKINNSFFHLQYQARPLHSNAHVFKISAPICTIFGTIEHRDILCMLRFHQLPNTMWCHLVKDKNSLFSYYKQLKSDFVEPSLFPGSVQKLQKIDFMNTIVLFKDLFDLSIVFVQYSFEIWRHHSLMLRAHKTFCQTLVQSADQIVNKYNASCCSMRSWMMASIFPSFNILLQLILFSNLSRLVLLNKLFWTPLNIR